MCWHHVNTEIRSALQELTHMDPKELQEFHKQYKKKFKQSLISNPGPATPVQPSTTSNRITTPCNIPALECLKNVENVARSTMAKNVVTTRDGRRKLTQIYNRMCKKKRTYYQGKDESFDHTTRMGREIKGSKLPTN